jgi:hypothetical protein
VSFLNILFLSHTHIGSTYVVGSHQLAKQFGLLGHNVLHMPMPLSPFHIVKFKMMKERWSYGVGNKFKPYKNVVQIIPFAPLPLKSTNSLYKKTVNKFIYKKHILKYMTELEINKFDLCLIDSPYLMYIVDESISDYTIYRPTDLYHKMENENSIKKLERDIVENVDGVICTNSDLVKYISSINVENKPVELIINGYEFSHFNQNLDLNESVESDVITYIGSLDMRFDYESMLNLVEKYPNINLNIYSPDVPMNDNLKRYYKGLISYNDVPNVLAKSKVLIMPFINSKVNHSRSPMKLFEYASSGKNIVMPAYMNKFELNNIYQYNSPNEFIYAIFEAMEKPCVQQNISVLHSNSWENKAKQVIDFVNTITK